MLLAFKFKGSTYPDFIAHLTKIHGAIDRMVTAFFTCLKRAEMKKREWRMKRKVSAVVSNTLSM